MLDMHGWDVNLSDFIDMAREQKWKEMGSLVSDDMLDAYAVVAKPEDLPGALKKTLWRPREPHPDRRILV